MLPIALLSLACRPADQHLYGGGRAIVSFASAEGAEAWEVEVPGLSEDQLDAYAAGDGLAPELSGAFAVADELGGAQGADDNWRVEVQFGPTEAALVQGLPCSSAGGAWFRASAEILEGAVDGPTDSARTTEADLDVAGPASLALAGELEGPQTGWEFHDEWTCDGAEGAIGRLRLSWEFSDEVHVVVRTEPDRCFGCLPSSGVSYQAPPGPPYG